jgi:NADH-quinone oxidoreductase subunit F
MTKEEREKRLTFHEIKNQGESRWQELWNGQRPLILVGTATCGRAAGALEVLKEMRGFLEREKLDFPVVEVGCMGHCYAERYPCQTGLPPICYGNVNPRKIDPQFPLKR